MPKIEQRHSWRPIEDLKPHPDGPNFFEFERLLLTNKFALVPGSANDPNSSFIHQQAPQAGVGANPGATGTPGQDAEPAAGGRGDESKAIDPVSR